jgi:hypothetical protein
MTWWFIVLGVSTLVIVFVAIALYVRIRSHMIPADAARQRVLDHIETDRHSDKL